MVSLRTLNCLKVSTEFQFFNGTNLIFVVKNFILMDLVCKISLLSVIIRKHYCKNNFILSVTNRWSTILGYMLKQYWLRYNNKKFLSCLKTLLGSDITNWKIHILNPKTLKDCKDFTNIWNMSKYVIFLINFKIKLTTILEFNCIIF